MLRLDSLLAVLGLFVLVELPHLVGGHRRQQAAFAMRIGGQTHGVELRQRSTKIPLPGSERGRDLSDLSIGQKLRGKVVGMYEGRTCRKAFVDVGVSRQGRRNMTFPVYGMIRLLGRYCNTTYSVGQVLDVYVSEVIERAGHLCVSLTPVFRRPDIDETGASLPVYRLSDLKVGMPLNGTVVSMTENYAWLDCGVLRDEKEVVESTAFNKQKKRRKARRVNGRLYRLDMLERFALAPKFVGPKTKGVVKPGLNMEVLVKGIHVDSQQYSLTLDTTITSEKARALKEERLVLLTKLSMKQPVAKLLLGERRKGVVTKVLQFGCKVGIGAKKTGFVALDSIEEAYGADIQDLSKVLQAGARLLVEIDEISDDEERVALRCIEILSQEPAGASKSKGGKAKVKTANIAADDDDDYADYEY